MNVNSVTNNQPKTDTTLNTPSPTVDYNAFLQLLIAQMKNQDPTSPTDMSQFRPTPNLIRCCPPRRCRRRKA